MQVDSDRSKSENEDNIVDENYWLPRTEIKLSGNARVNIKPQSKYIQALIHRAVDLGERYVFLGPPEDDEIAIGDVPNMTTPFSVAGLHSIAFSALLSAAQQLGYTDDDDIYDRLQNGSEESYIKPLRYHVCDSIIFKLQITLMNHFIFFKQVFQRLGLARALALSNLSSALPSVIKLDKTNKGEIGNLLNKNNYIFTKKPNSEVMQTFLRVEILICGILGFFTNWTVQE